jgi:hypothetical protein
MTRATILFSLTLTAGLLFLSQGPAAAQTPKGAAPRPAFSKANMDYVVRKAAMMGNLSRPAATSVRRELQSMRVSKYASSRRRFAGITAACNEMMRTYYRADRTNRSPLELMSADLSNKVLRTTIRQAARGKHAVKLDPKLPRHRQAAAIRFAVGIGALTGMLHQLGD